jgi:hypothetical protein
MSEETKKFTPEHRFYIVDIVVNTEDMESGKVKKVKEVHLVDAVSPTDVETKVAEEMSGTMWEWSIESMKTSKISVVY